MKSQNWIILAILAYIVYIAWKSGIFQGTGGGGTALGDLGYLQPITPKTFTPVETTSYVDRILQTVTPPTPLTYNQNLLSLPVETIISGTPPQERIDQWWTQAAPTSSTGKTWTPAEIAQKNREAGLGQAYGAGVGFGGGGAGIRSGATVRQSNGGGGAGVR